MGEVKKNSGSKKNSKLSRVGYIPDKISILEREIQEKREEQNKCKLDLQDIQDISKLKIGDKILVECTVNAVFPNSGIVMVTTYDCDEGFDAYPYEIKGVVNQIEGEE